MNTAYSYMRFSSDPQADGDSIRRQTAAAESWCKRHGLTLDASKTMRDEGRSAYRGKQRTASALAAFLDEVATGNIPRGSHLIIENLDRLSRENPWDAVPLLCSIVNAGVVVVTLSPTEMVYKRDRDLTGLILAVVEFGRGHSESVVKSDRVGAAWAEKKRRARDTREVVTRNLPSWIDERDGKLHLIPEAAKSVRRVFALCIAGYGVNRIVHQLTEEGREPISSAWRATYVYSILTSRAAIGEYQPSRRAITGKRGTRLPDGPPIPNYFPAVVSVEVFDRAQAALKRRSRFRGRVSTLQVALFSGLLTDASTGSRYWIKKNSRNRLSLLSAATDAGKEAPTLSYPIFEAAVLPLMREISPADLGTDDSPESEVTALRSEIETLASKIDAMKAKLRSAGDISVLLDMVAELDAEKKEKEKRLAEVQRAGESSVGETWAEALTLLRLDKLTEPQRVKLRDVLRRSIESVYVLIVPHSKQFRYAAVQVFFHGGTTRTYVLAVWTKTISRPEEWRVVTQLGSPWNLRDEAGVALCREELLSEPPPPRPSDAC